MLKCHMDKNQKAQNGLVRLVAQGIMKYHEVLHSKESYCSSYIASYIMYPKDSLKASKDWMDWTSA